MRAVILKRLDLVEKQVDVGVNMAVDEKGYAQDVTGCGSPCGYNATKWQSNLSGSVEFENQACGDLKSHLN